MNQFIIEYLRFHKPKPGKRWPDLSPLAHQLGLSMPYLKRQLSEMRKTGQLLEVGYNPEVSGTYDRAILRVCYQLTMEMKPITIGRVSRHVRAERATVQRSFDRLQKQGYIHKRELDCWKLLKDELGRKIKVRVEIDVLAG